jgi:NuA3 HAT complex component NTO1
MEFMSDQAWLDTLNLERKKDQSGPVSYEAFEIIMDKLEKEWFNLVGNSNIL